METTDIDRRPAKRSRDDADAILSQLPTNLRDFVENRAFAGKPFALAACVQRAVEEIMLTGGLQNIEKLKHGGKALCKGVYAVEVGGLRPSIGDSAAPQELPLLADVAPADDTPPPEPSCSCTCKAAEGSMVSDSIEEGTGTGPAVLPKLL
mgnify:CR=1 FL=1